MGNDPPFDSEVASSGSELQVAEQNGNIKIAMEGLQEELTKCRSELLKMQKQLEQSVRLQEITESYNQDLRLQVMVSQIKFACYTVVFE